MAFDPYWPLTPFGLDPFWPVTPFGLKNGNWVQEALVADDEVVNLVPFESLPFDLSAIVGLR